MTQLPPELQHIDWSVTTFEGARREQLRRWSQLSLDEVLAALEDMADIAELFGSSRAP